MSLSIDDLIGCPSLLKQHHSRYSLLSSQVSFWSAIFVVCWIASSLDDEWTETRVIPLYTLFVVVYLVTAAFSERNESSSHAKKHQHTATAATVEEDDGKHSTTNETTDIVGTKVNLTGTYKLTEMRNLEEFLLARDVPWPLRYAARKSQPIYRITQKGKELNIRLEGVVTTEFKVEIGQPPKQITVRNDVFIAEAFFMKDGRHGITTLQRDVKNNDLITTNRFLVNNNIHVETTVTFDPPEGKDPVSCFGIFERIE